MNLLAVLSLSAAFASPRAPVTDDELALLRGRPERAEVLVPDVFRLVPVVRAAIVPKCAHLEPAEEKTLTTSGSSPYQCRCPGAAAGS